MLKRSELGGTLLYLHRRNFRVFGELMMCLCVYVCTFMCLSGCYQMMSTSYKAWHEVLIKQPLYFLIICIGEELMPDQMQSVMILSARLFQKVSDKAQAEQSCVGYVETASNSFCLLFLFFPLSVLLLEASKLNFLCLISGEVNSVVLHANRLYWAPQKNSVLLPRTWQTSACIYLTCNSAGTARGGCWGWESEISCRAGWKRMGWMCRIIGNTDTCTVNTTTWKIKSSLESLCLYRLRF